jgi:hypothetical protein
MGGKKRTKKIEPPGPGACVGLPAAGKGGGDVRRDFLEIVDEAMGAQGDSSKAADRLFARLIAPVTVQEFYRYIIISIGK